MFEMISIVVVTLRQQQTIETRALIERVVTRARNRLRVRGDALPQCAPRARNRSALGFLPGAIQNPSRPLTPAWT